MSDVQQQSNNYAMLGNVKVYLNPYDLTVASYEINAGKKYNLLQVIQQFISYFGIIQDINVEHSQHQELPIDDDHEKPVFVQLAVHKDDISLIGSDSPIRINCLSDAFTTDKEAFVDFIQDLYDVMKQ